MSLQVQSLCCGYHRKTILQDVSFELKPSCVTAVLGINGSGKTTLFKSLLGMIPLQSGSVLCEGKSLSGMSLRQRARYLACVAQKNQVQHLHVYEAVLMGRIPHIGAATRRADYEKVEQVLNLMKLQEFSGRHLSELSGGEFQKVMLARALVQDTPYMLLDEPTSALDIRNRHEVMKEVRRLAHSMNLGVLIAVHDMNLALRYADQFLLLIDGCVEQTNQLDAARLEQVYSVAIDVIEHGGHRVAVYQEN